MQRSGSSREATGVTIQGTIKVKIQLSVISLRDVVAGYTVRTPHYRYTEYVSLLDEGLDTQQPDWDSPRDWGELYDLSVDPLETKNLFRQEGWEEVRNTLSQTLHQGWSQHN